MGATQDAVVVVETGERRSHGELDARAKALATFLRTNGLNAGDHIAIVLPNCAQYYEIAWAAQNSGLYYTPVNWHLAEREVAYIVEDCGAKAVFTSEETAALVAPVVAASSDAILCLDVDPAAGETSSSYERALASCAGAEDWPDDEQGAWMIYSSGTTGWPKGVKNPRNPDGLRALRDAYQVSYGLTPDARYLCPAPLYHAMPLGLSLGVQLLGGSVYLMERFDPAAALAAIEEHRITHAGFVPTMFIRMLKLPPEVRESFDVSSLEHVLHAGAPCPVWAKEQMMEWWGPILYEYYGGTETGTTFISPEEWLAHPGSVGRSPLVHVVDERGAEVPAGVVGNVYFDSAAAFEYHNDASKTKDAYNERGWATLGDIGYLDDDGYLYLTDRKAYMLISGGVNIYPQEIENALVRHPAVADVAVFGVPDEEMGESVHAVVQLEPGFSGDDAMADELIRFCRSEIAHYKCPRSLRFADELPRLASGKLLKRALRDEYLAARQAT